MLSMFLLKKKLTFKINKLINEVSNLKIIKKKTFKVLQIEKVINK